MTVTGSQVLVEVKGIHKKFGATYALRGVDAKFQAGRVHALLGTNGCGKSTLVKILAGYHQQDAGEIISASSPTGQVPIAFVHQDLALVPQLSVSENIGLVAGFPLARMAINGSELKQQTARLLEENLISCSADDPVGSLGPAEQTMVAIVRALATLPEVGGVLVLDEPTARLPASETCKLLEMINGLKSHGVAIAYISHRLDEVMELADEVTVLRDGVCVYNGFRDQFDKKELIRRIVGKPSNVAPVEQRRSAKARLAAPVLSVSNLSGRRVQDVSLEIFAGEVLGIAGLVGSGRSELGRLIFGLQRSRRGQVLLGGRDVTNLPPAKTVELGIAYVPQERVQGVFVGLPIEENAILAELGSVMGRLGVSSRKIRSEVETVLGRFQVKHGGTGATIDTLSGGNQQKVSLGKWFRRDLKLLLLDEPTQGIDIGARTDIMTTVRDIAREKGVAVLVLDSDLEVLANFCDRALVMVGGQIVREIQSEHLIYSDLSEAVYGH